MQEKSQAVFDIDSHIDNSKLGMYRIFASVPNSGLNSVFVFLFGRIVYRTIRIWQNSLIFNHYSAHPYIANYLTNFIGADDL